MAGSGEIADGESLALVSVLDLDACIRRGMQDLAVVVALLGHLGCGELGGDIRLVTVGGARVCLDR